MRRLGDWLLNRIAAAIVKELRPALAEELAARLAPRINARLELTPEEKARLRAEWTRSYRK